MILAKNMCFQNIKIKLNSGTLMTLKSPFVIFKALELLQPQWPQQPQQPQWPQWPRQPHFIKKNTNPDGWIIPGTKNDQYLSLFVEWIIKIHLIHILRNHVSKEKYKKYFRKNFAIVPFNFPRIPQTSRFSFGHKTNWFRHFHFKKCQNVLTSFLEYVQ